MTVSDRGSRGEREDKSGQVLFERLESQGFEVCCQTVVPDECDQIRATLIDLADTQKVPLILTTGGTGVAPRDVTPEATLSVLDRAVPGMAEAMRAAGLAHTPHAMLSRAVAGQRGHCIIVNLSGSPKAVREQLGALLPALPHALETVTGIPRDCAPAPKP